LGSKQDREKIMTRSNLSRNERVAELPGGICLRLLGILALVVALTGSFLIAGEFPSTNISDEGLRAINGTKLYCKVIGSGPTLVVLHGGPGMDHSYFLPQMERLASHYRLIFYDQRASGKSVSDVDTNSMTMATFVEDLEGIRKEFKLGKMNLLGHSWGGLVAMFYAAKYPQNLNSLILSNTTPASAALRNASFAVMARHTTPEDSAAQAALIRTEGFRKRESHSMEKFLRLLFRGSFADRRYADSVTLSLDTSYATKSRLINFFYKDSILASYDLHDRLRAVRCPVLILGGDHDMVPAEAQEAIHSHIKGSTLLLMKNCGHFPFVEKPGEFFPAVREFLERATAKR
jgi:proline iminopeptidase